MPFWTVYVLLLPSAVQSYVSCRSRSFASSETRSLRCVQVLSFSNTSEETQQGPFGQYKFLDAALVYKSHLILVSCRLRGLTRLTQRLEMVWRVSFLGRWKARSGIYSRVISGLFLGPSASALLLSRKCQWSKETGATDQQLHLNMAKKLTCYTAGVSSSYRLHVLVLKFEDS